VVAAADALLRDAAVREAATPEVVLMLGRPWASRVLAEFVEASARGGAEVVAVGTSLSDPARVVHEFHRVPAGRFVIELSSVTGDPAPGWRARFEAMEAAAQAAIAKALDNDALSEGGRTNEPRVARHLFGSLDARTTLFVASSMPVRDLEWFAAPRPAAPRVLSNRGVNGIDGITSTALGVAAAGAGPVVALLGDLAFFHDASALVSVAEERGSCTLVVVDNDGGGIFNFLPQARALEHDRFEQLFGTRPNASVAEVARGFGLPVADVSTLDSLDDALERFVGREARAVVRVQVPSREENVGLHDRIHTAVAEAVRPILTG
jgi:2-succinyl-5-enolpyruvyl-6-hydroxy-3-cyclohexene-1-carboxylate synthase